MTREVDISEHKDLLKSDDTFKYQLLSRMQMDCNYYLGNGGKHKKHLWAQDEKEQIEVMKMLWNNFSDKKKPEWLTWDDILTFENKMVDQEVLSENIPTKDTNL